MRVSRMTVPAWVLVALVLPAVVGAQSVRAVVGGTLVDGTGAAPVPDAVVVIRDGHISCAGPRATCKVPSGAQQIDARGMWITPGLIDAHVHFSQTGWFDARPDAVDLRDTYPYAKVVADLEANPERFFRAYRCAGVTSVFDVGGFAWTWALRERFGSDSAAPRIGVAGPLLATIDHWLNLPSQKVIIHMSSDTVVRAVVGEEAAYHSDAVKVWYIMPPQPVDTARAQALVRVAAAEARANNMPMIVHATGLWEAKDAIRAGASVLVHSVFESRVDSEFIALAQEHQVVYVSTIMAYAGYIAAAQGGLDKLPYPTACVDSATVAHLQAGPPPGRDTYFTSARERERAANETSNAMANLKMVSDAGITVAMGTDAGNPGTLHGPSVFREMELMQQAGLTPMQVLVASTKNSAIAMGRGDSAGTLVPGKWADMVVLAADPTTDIRNVQRIRLVIKGGAFWKP